MTKKEQLEITLYGYLALHANGENADRPYLIDHRRILTYAQTYRIVNSLAHEFMEMGVRKGQLVALRATRSADTAILTLAFSSFGTVCVMCDSHFGVEEYIQNTGVEIAPDWYCTDEEGSWKIYGKQSHGALVFLEEGENVQSPTVSVQADEPFRIIFTSGSTGKSKAVLLSHKNCMAGPIDANPLYHEDNNDVAISLLPLHHVGGFAVLSCATFAGHTLVFPEGIEAEKVLSYIEKYKVTCFYAVPTMLLGMVEGDKQAEYDLSTLRFVLTLGAPSTKEQRALIEEKLDIKVLSAYGMSECVGITTLGIDEPFEKRVVGVGKAYPMTEITIVDGGGNALPQGQEGEICVKGPCLMMGYYNDEALTKTVVDDQGRLHTGDLGYLDEEGILHVSGRMKDIIIRGGENISVGKVEEAILSLEGVYQVAVVPVKDEKMGERVGAVIQLKNGYDYTYEGTRAALKDKLSKHEIPEIIRFTAELPKTSAGKIDKMKVKEALLL